MNRIPPSRSMIAAYLIALAVALVLTYPAIAGDGDPNIVSAGLIGASFDNNKQTQDSAPGQTYDSLTHEPVGYAAIRYSDVGGKQIIWHNVARPGAGIAGMRDQGLDLASRIKPGDALDVFVIGLTADILRYPAELEMFYVQVINQVRWRFPTTRIVAIKYPSHEPIWNAEVLALATPAEYYERRARIEAILASYDIPVVDIWQGWYPREDGFHPKAIGIDPITPSQIAAQRLNAAVRAAAQ